MVHIAEFSTRDSPKPMLEEEELHWIEIKLIGEDGEPISGEKYKVVLPDGAVVEGALDGEGLARVDDIPQAGRCIISFPELDREAWDPV
jgi:type VI secretion system secreted protein VgrG